MSDRINIVFVIHDANPVPYFNWFAEKASHQNKFNFKFVFLNNECTHIKAKMAEYGAEVIWVPFNNSSKKKSLIFAYFKLVKIFRKLKPDIVHSHLFYDGVVAMRAAKKAGVKIRIQTKQSTGFNWYFAPSAVKFDKFKNRNATHLIAVSNEAKRFVLEKEEADPNKVFMVNHGVDINEVTNSDANTIEELKKKYNPEGKLMFVMVARYIDWKGYKFFIKAAAEVLKNHENVIFLGVGTGAQESELRALIKELGIEKDFILTGFIQREIIPSLYKAANVYVHTALREPFGFVLAEAMLNRLPLITTPTGAAGDSITHLEEGYLVRYENIQDVVDAIQYMIKLPLDQRSEMGKKAMEKATSLFSFDKMWEGYTQIYCKAIKELRSE